MHEVPQSACMRHIVGTQQAGTEWEWAFHALPPPLCSAARRPGRGCPLAVPILSPTCGGPSSTCSCFPPDPSFSLVTSPTASVLTHLLPLKSLNIFEVTIQSLHCLGLPTTDQEPGRCQRQGRSWAEQPARLPVGEIKWRPWGFPRPFVGDPYPLGQARM